MRSVCILLACMAVEASGATVIGVGRSSGEAGESVTTPISLASDIPIVGLQVDLGYNPEEVSFGTITKGAPLGSAYLVQSSEIEPGRYRILLYSSDNSVLTDGSVLEIPLNFIGTVAPGQRAIELLEIQLADASGLSRNYRLAPFLEIIQPGAAGEYQLGSNLQVEVDAYASGADLQSVSLYIDGELAGSDTMAPYRFDWSPSRRGRVELLAVATDSLDVQAEATRVLQILSNFDNWARESFPVEQQSNPFYAGFSADPDADGKVNGIEYLTNSNPLSADEGSLMESGIVTDGGQNYLTLSFEIPDSVDDVSFEVYGSSQANPGNLTDAAPAILIEEILVSEGVRLRTYRDSVPFGSGSRFMFIRSALGTQ